ncbi:hypothetical protein GYMLUDRAFT_240877 [Collybiopsis luxurians FD-317 M1]|nr:hypothetical protein GYMLUDRAFT_240877 [Collybiopsis luxurians FD-317 M1]
MALPRTLSVIGAGQMGIGIALVASPRAQIPKVLLYDRDPAQITKGLAFMDKLLEKDDGDESGWARDLGERGTNLVNLSTDTVLASNTSSISIMKLAGAAVDGLGAGMSRASEEGKACAGRVVGVHFFNPVPALKLCEVIPGLQKSESTLEKAKAFAVACGKEVTTLKDVPGFVSNALLMPFLNEIFYSGHHMSGIYFDAIAGKDRCSHHFPVLVQGTAARDDIDKTLRLGMGHPMGPLQLGTRDSKYRPSVLLGRMVDAGWLGKKSGKGFYDY